MALPGSEGILHRPRTAGLGSLPDSLDTALDIFPWPFMVQPRKAQSNRREAGNLVIILTLDKRPRITNGETAGMRSIACLMLFNALSMIGQSPSG